MNSGRITKPMMTGDNHPNTTSIRPKPDHGVSFQRDSSSLVIAHAPKHGQLDNLRMIRSEPTSQRNVAHVERIINLTQQPASVMSLTLLPLRRDSRENQFVVK